MDSENKANNDIPAKEICIMYPNIGEKILATFSLLLAVGMFVSLGAVLHLKDKIAYLFLVFGTLELVMPTAMFFKGTLIVLISTDGIQVFDAGKREFYKLKWSEFNEAYITRDFRGRDYFLLSKMETTKKQRRKIVKQTGYLKRTNDNALFAMFVLDSRKTEDIERMIPPTLTLQKDEYWLQT